MRTFVSYSFKDSELYVVTLLIEQLKKSGHIVDTSTFNVTVYDNRIKNSDTFIGIITNNSNSVNHVINEWNIAKHNNIKNILIIEDGVRVEDSNGLNFIRFNRNNPNLAIDQLFNINRNNSLQKNKQNGVIEDVLVAGGIIVGVAALLALLSGGGKK